AAEDQPGLVAVPHRRHRIHDDVAVFVLREEGKQNAEAEVEAVHHDIEEHRKGDDEGPDGWQVDWDHGEPLPPASTARTLCSGVIPAAIAGSPALGPSSPRCGAAAIKCRM